MDSKRLTNDLRPQQEKYLEILLRHCQKNAFHYLVQFRLEEFSSGLGSKCALETAGPPVLDILEALFALCFAHPNNSVTGTPRALASLRSVGSEGFTLYPALSWAR